MKTWRESKIGNDIKRPQSKNMKGILNEEKTRKNLKKQKDTQRRLITQANDELQKINQSFISLDGVRTFSDSSLKKLQNKRQKQIQKLRHTISELDISSKNLKDLEKSYRKYSKS